MVDPHPDAEDPDVDQDPNPHPNPHPDPHPHQNPDDEPDPDDPGPADDPNPDDDPDADADAPAEAGGYGPADDEGNFTLAHPSLNHVLVAAEGRTAREIFAMILALGVSSNMDYKNIIELGITAPCATLVVTPVGMQLV